MRVSLSSHTPQEQAALEEASTLALAQYRLSWQTRGMSPQIRISELSVMLITLGRVAMVKIGAQLSSQIIRTVHHWALCRSQALLLQGEYLI